MTLATRLLAVRYAYMETPIGKLLIAGDGHQLSHVGFPSGKGAVTPEAGWVLDADAFRHVQIQLAEYFEGARQMFDVPIALRGTPFQLAVWREVSRIPFGATVSYGEVAKRIGCPAASRAVGAANGVNPIPIIVPCHRVIGSTGKLTGFGGGLETKRRLLDLEASSIANGQIRLAC